MRYLVWILRLLIFLLVLVFALGNTAPVAVTFYSGLVLQDIPLIVVMLAAFVLGAVFGLLLTIPGAMRRRREAARLRRELDRLQETTPAAPVQPAPAVIDAGLPAR